MPATAVTQNGKSRQVDSLQKISSPPSPLEHLLAKKAAAVTQTDGTEHAPATASGTAATA